MSFGAVFQRNFAPVSANFLFVSFHSQFLHILDYLLGLETKESSHTGFVFDDILNEKFSFKSSKFLIFYFSFF